MEETKLEKAMRHLATTDSGKILKGELKALRDMPLMSETNEMTFHKIGRRDFAIDLLSMMEEKNDE